MARIAVGCAAVGIVIDQDVASFQIVAVVVPVLVTPYISRTIGASGIGYYSYSKVLDNSMLDKVEDIVNDTINKGINDILDAKFDINPKRIGKDDIGCEYCPFKDICFKTERDVVTYPKKDIKDILGGDINA